MFAQDHNAGRWLLALTFQSPSACFSPGLVQASWVDLSCLCGCSAQRALEKSRCPVGSHSDLRGSKPHQPPESWVSRSPFGAWPQNCGVFVRHGLSSQDSTWLSSSKRAPSMSHWGCGGSEASLSVCGWWLFLKHSGGFFLFLQVDSSPSILLSTQKAFGYGR